MTAAIAIRPLAPRVSTPTVASTLSTHHSEDEWAAVYPLIEQLYVRERRRLRDVMTRMEEQHRFRATVQMYKKRFAKWGFHKNARRSRSGGQDGPEAMAVALFASKTTTPRVAPRVIRLNTSDSAQALFLSNVKAWSQSFFNLDSSLPPHQSSDNGNAPEQLSFTFRVVVGLLQRDQGALAGRLARKAFLQAEGLLQGEGPLVVWNTLDIFRNIAANCQDVLGNMLLDHLVNLARDKPLVEVLQSFRGMVRAWQSEGVPVRHDALERAWALNADLVFSRFHPKYLLMYYRLVWDSDLAMLGSEISGLVGGWFSRLHEKIDETSVDEMPSISGGPKSLSDSALPDGFDKLKSEITIAIRERAAMEHKDPIIKIRVLSALLKSRVLEDDALNPRNPDLDFARLQARIMAYTAKIIANVDDKENRSPEASIPWARTIVALREFGQDPTGPQTVAEMWRLEELLNRAGHIKEAAQLREESYRRLEQYLADVPEDTT